MKYLKPFKLYEKSSLTPLGVPDEVMKDIQINFEIDSKSSWSEISLKKDVLNQLKKDEKNLFISISNKGNIFIFINNHNQYKLQYFKLEKTGWSSFRIDNIEDITYTQLSYVISMKDKIYILDNSNFEVDDKKYRKLEKQKEKLNNITQDFKMYIITHFNSILKKLYGNKHKIVMLKIVDNISSVKKDLNTDELLHFLEDNKKLADIAKQYELSKDDDDILKIKNLEKQYNSLTVLDEYLLDFENEYSILFNMHLTIKDLIETFGRMPIETAFMYFLYTGRVKNLKINV